uniref:Uncharacterized protein n=1 Tax=Oryza meridionalis TaxID=40149 RepID=A0A0E0CHG3_9ORYZ
MLHRWVVLELRRLEVHVADGTRHLDDPLHPPRAAGVDHDLAVIGVERSELPPDLLRGHVVLGREPLGDGLTGCRVATEDGAGVAGVGDVEHVVGDGAQEAAGARGGRAGHVRQRPPQQLLVFLVGRQERLPNHVNVHHAAALCCELCSIFGANKSTKDSRNLNKSK